MCIRDSTTIYASDYVDDSGTLTFAPGETVRTALVQIRNDLITEPTETFRFLLSNPTGATISRNTATVTIIDNDNIVATPTMYVDDITVNEADGSARFVVRLGNTQGESSDNVITVDYTTVAGSAAAGQDFIAASGTLRFEPFESVKVISIALFDDCLLYTSPSPRD